MENYVLKKLNSKIAQYLVFSTSVESPFFMLNEITKDIHESKDVVVIFDQLLQTGDSDNRFMSITFKNNAFDLNSANKIDSKTVNNVIREEIANFLRENPTILKYSILLSNQKEQIEKGGIL